jgi:hypothetical protein
VGAGGKAGMGWSGTAGYSDARPLRPLKYPSYLPLELQLKDKLTIYLQRRKSPHYSRYMACYSQFDPLPSLLRSLY